MNRQVGIVLWAEVCYLLDRRRPAKTAYRLDSYRTRVFGKLSAQKTAPVLRKKFFAYRLFAYRTAIFYSDV